MNKLDVAQYLLTELKEEKALLETYEADYKQAGEKARKTDGWIWDFTTYKGRIPKKSVIKANCLKIRQIMLEISKEEI